MSLRIAKPNAPAPAERRFGLRLEARLLQLVIATPLGDGRYRLDFDERTCGAAGGWTSPANTELLRKVLTELGEQHEIRRERIAVSLDGDFCVTRVVMGTSEAVDKEQSELAIRVPRYLQLGPGEKATGGARKSISPTIDYAVTGVVNRSLIESIYEAFRAGDWNVLWVEPALVSAARLLGLAQVGGDRPILIADGTGNHWDVGIACAGRLLLDYRPAAATDARGLCDALDGHLSRLRRFCGRHLGIATGELRELYLCGSEQKTAEAAEVFGELTGLETKLMRVPKLDELYVVDDLHRDSSSVPPVATVLPLLIDVEPEDVPDLLNTVRRDPDLPWATRLLRAGWPLIAATLLSIVSYGLVSAERSRQAGSRQGKQEIESKIRANEVRFFELSVKRDLLSQLIRIQQQSRETEWHTLFMQVTQSLPNSARLNNFRVESDGQVRLTGTVIDESIVFELVNVFRRLPNVTQVALRGTTPDESTGGIQFTIGLTTAQAGQSHSPLDHTREPFDE